MNHIYLKREKDFDLLVPEKYYVCGNKNESENVSKIFSFSNGGKKKVTNHKLTKITVDKADNYAFINLHTLFLKMNS